MIDIEPKKRRFHMRTKRLTLELLTLTLAVSMVFLVPHPALTAGAGDKTAVETEARTEPVEDISHLRERIDESTEVLQTMLERTDERIPPQFIRDAAGIAIFPDMTKVALGFGGRHGGGVLMLNQNGEWTGPIFLSLYGASVGMQLGAEETDLVMVFTTQKGLDEFSDGELQLGAEASAVAGVYGAKAGAATEADVLVYKQTSGLFAGASLTGAVLDADDENNRVYFEKESDRKRAYYGQDKLLSGKEDIPRTQQAKQLMETLKQYTQKQ
jgi:lipid-binding SYLF domain-containing protein